MAKQGFAMWSTQPVACHREPMLSLPMLLCGADTVNCSHSKRQLVGR